MKKFNIKFHDGSAFHSLISIINKTLGCIVPLMLERNRISIKKMNGLKTCVFDVEFNTDFILEYIFEGDEPEIIVLSPEKISSKKMKKNDIIKIHRNEDDESRITSTIISNNRTNDGGSIVFFNNEYKPEEFDIEVPEPVYKYCITLDILCDMFKHSNDGEFTAFSFQKSGFQVIICDKNSEVKWKSSKNYTCDSEEYVCQIYSRITLELSKLSSLHQNGTCSVMCYGEELIVIETPVSCYGMCKIYLTNPHYNS